MHRKKIKGNVPVKCSMCKEKNAYHTVHGFSWQGRTICDDCYKVEKEKHEKEEREKENDEETEAEYQINRILDRY